MDLPLGRVGAHHWRFVLVPGTAREVFLRKSGGELRSLGVQPKGFVASLTLGDAVYVRGKYGMRLVFRLTSHRTRGVIIKYGEGWGPRPGQYRVLDRLSFRAFANAGVEPAGQGESQ